MTEERKKFLDSLKLPTLFLLLILIIELTKYLSGYSFVQFGILPREISGLVGIVTAPLIHSNIKHLFSNAIPLLVLGTSIYYFYPESSKSAIPIIYLFTNFLVWLFARESYHIGASGIVYGLASFLFFSGIIKKDRRAITLSLLTSFLYGGMVIGIFPTKEGVSWESHLFGFLTGLVLAIFYRKKDPFKKYDWEDEELEEDVRNLKISYKKGNPFEQDDLK
ncbi:MAG: rhomboid family intramembrane serine protease [Melioribacteraceae bacterium]|nr:rhomboid family intramembrane serine protease [Melioribacteraceae bacterium]